MTAGTFHNFDVAAELSRKGLLEKIYTFGDPLRVHKYRKNIPLRKICSPWYPLFNRRGKISPGVRERIGSKLRKDQSDIILGMAQWSLKAFQAAPRKFRILDADHFNWHPGVVPLLARYGLKRFDLNSRVDPEKYIMQYRLIEAEYSKRGLGFQISAEQIVGEILELEEADLVLVPVSYVRDALIAAGFPPDKVCLIPYGYDPDVFSPPPRSPGNRMPRLLFGGTVSVRKGWYYLKEIINRFPMNPPADFIVAGSVAEEVKNDVKEFALAQRGRVSFLGRLSQSRLAEEMRRADLFVFPSVLEGFGLTVLQALACGTPVIASRATCGIDLIIDGENGFVLGIDDTDGWIDKIGYYLRLSSKERNRYSSAACRSAQGRDWSAYVERLLAVARALAPSLAIPPEAGSGGQSS